MQQYSAVDGFMNDWHLVHYGSRAVGGAGLIITESAVVHPAGRSTLHDLGIWKDDHVPGLKRMTDFIRAHGAASAVQLAHFGSKGSKSHPKDGFQPLGIEHGGWQTVSSSSTAPFPGMSVPLEIPREELATYQGYFVQAARRAVMAGFDAIELHAAHGYLFHQFYSKLINERTDDHGGDFAARIRFLLDTVRLIRLEIPSSMPLLVRISAVDHSAARNAWSIADSVQLVWALKGLGVDVVTASAGGFVWVDKSKEMEGYQVEYADAIKQVTGAVGGIRTAAYADSVIAEGKADLVVIAREHLRDPYFAIHSAVTLGESGAVPVQYARAF